MGNTAKLNAGGGDGVDHSSQHPFQGSPVTVPQFIPLADADHKLNDLQHDPRQNDHRATTPAINIQGRHSGTL